MKDHFMIDLETMGIRPTSAIISIGVVQFNATEQLSSFYTAVSLKSSIEAGMTTDQSTIDWWAKQSAVARAAWDTPDAPTLLSAMKGLQDYILYRSSVSSACPWGNGADFDIPIVNHAYFLLGADAPWKFYNHHCFRTLKNLFPGTQTPRHGTHHNALDDAKSQVNQLHEILRLHKLNVL